MSFFGSNIAIIVRIINLKYKNNDLFEIYHFSKIAFSGVICNLYVKSGSSLFCNIFSSSLKTIEPTPDSPGVVEAIISWSSCR